jgi:acetyl esterase
MMKEFDPEIVPFIESFEEAFASTPPHLMKAGNFRKRVDELGARSRPPLPDQIKATDLAIPTRFGEIGARLYSPTDVASNRCLIYMHGGGWTVGSIDTHDPICAQIAAKTPCSVLSLNYSLSPEFPFPRALMEVLDATAWLGSKSANLEIDADHISIGGDSCGGNLATAACLYLRDHSDSPVPFRCQILAYPILDTNFDTRSYCENQTTPFLYSDLCKWFWNNYLGNPKDWDDGYAVPMKASSLAGLPPAYISVAEFDPLRDEGIAYAERLRAGGNEAVLSYIHRQIHGFLRLRAISSVAEIEFDRMCEFLASKG